MKSVPPWAEEEEPREVAPAAAPAQTIHPRSSTANGTTSPGVTPPRLEGAQHEVEHDRQDDRRDNREDQAAGQEADAAASARSLGEHHAD